MSAVSSLVVRSTGMKVLVSGWQIAAQVERARMTGGTLVLLQMYWDLIHLLNDEAKANAKKARNRRDQCS